MSIQLLTKLLLDEFTVLSALFLYNLTYKLKNKFDDKLYRLSFHSSGTRALTQHRYILIIILPIKILLHFMKLLVTAYTSYPRFIQLNSFLNIIAKKLLTSHHFHLRYYAYPIIRSSMYNGYIFIYKFINNDKLVKCQALDASFLYVMIAYLKHTL